MPNQWQRRCVLPSYGEPYFVERQWRLTFFKSLNFYAVVRRVWQAAPGIVFTTCMSVHSFVHLLPNLSTRYFESEWTDFDANWQSSPQGNGMKRSTSGSVGQRSRSHEAEGRFGGLAEALFSTSLGHSFTTGWAKLNGVNAVSFVAVKHALENCDTFWQVK